VIDLKITEGQVQAQVMGSSLYKIAVRVNAVPSQLWQSISADCAGSIDTLVELLQGRLSKAVMERICSPNTGLFPAPKEIEFTCSCPDWAAMCKHVAAVLYGVGARLDQQPELIFALRRVDAKALVTKAGAGLPKSKQGKAKGKVLDDALLADVFGIEMADVAPATKPAATRHKSTATKAANTAASTATKKTPAAEKIKATTKTVAAKKPVKAKVPTKPSVSPRKPSASKAKAGGTKTVPKGKAATTGPVPARSVKKKV